MNIIFNIQGGLGKTIMATAVCSVIKKHYPDSFLIVVSGFPEVFLNNRNVNKAMRHQDQMGIYNKYIKNMDCKFFVLDPYHTDSYHQQDTHLIETWCETFGFEYNGELPEFFLSKAEKQFYSTVYKTKKPILAIQTHGGGQNQGTTYNWARDLPSPLIVNLINKFKKDYTIIHIKRADQPAFENTLQAHDNFRSIAYLLTVSQKRLLIDSFAQHLAIALNKPSVVAWITTSPKVFGYKQHTNIKANEFVKKPLHDHPIYSPFNLVEHIHTLPYNELNEIFDQNSLYNALKA